MPRQNITALLDREIADMERQLNALKAARSAISGGGGSVRAARRSGSRRPGQRTFTAAQRAEQSRKMKLYWAKRRRDKSS